LVVAVQPVYSWVSSIIWPFSSVISAVTAKYFEQVQSLISAVFVVLVISPSPGRDPPGLSKYNFTSRIGSAQPLLM
jgi:hypothetical protein